MPALTTNHIAIEKQLATGGCRIRCPWCNGLNRDSGEYVSGRQPGDPLCCDEFAAAVYQIITQVIDDNAKYPARVRQAAEMTERMNLIAVERQILTMTRKDYAGDGVLWCPYCRIGNRQGNPELCCFDLGEAVAGVLARMEIQRQVDQASKITENADRLKECGVTVQ